MQRFEYKVVPAPKRGEKARGVRTTEERFALALTQMMNALGADGWDYVRADTLPCDERVGLTGSKTTYQNMLVFRRAIEADAAVVPAFNSLRAPADMETDAPFVRLGAAQVSPGTAPAIGPAKTDIAAE